MYKFYFFVGLVYKLTSKDNVTLRTVMLCCLIPTINISDCRAFGLFHVKFSTDFLSKRGQVQC